jgi:hypothetical protein
MEAVSEKEVSSIMIVGSSTTGLITPIASDKTDLYTQISKKPMMGDGTYLASSVKTRLITK